MADDDVLTGKLLVASPALTDPNFNRTVILVVRHTAEEGAFGLVINRPIDGAPLAEQLPAWAERAAPPVQIFRGGPVEPGAAFALGRFPENAPPPGEAVLPGVAVVDLTADAEAALGLEAVRVFGGYAGWSPSQLETELRDSAWFVVDALPSDAFATEPVTLWRDVLKRQPGALAMFAHFPPAPNVN